MATFVKARPSYRCPDRGVLADFDLGRLNATDSAAVAEHLSSCERCEGILLGLQRHNAGDPLLVLLKKCLDGPNSPTDLVCSTMEYVSGWYSRGSAAPARATQAVVPDAAVGGVPPRLIGPYLVYGKLGQGGMGVVYRAQQVPLKRNVALKMILAGQYAAAPTVARFLREGKTVARLRHPNVVQVYDLGEADGLPYYSMELVEGGNLQARLADGPLAPREAALLLRTLALAVEYAHGEGVVHRDLKPANILLSEDGTPKITDFGLAKLLDTEGDGDEHATAALTATDMIVGTPNYMAPEQAEGLSEGIGRASDIYALGAILYATLTGRPPFAGETRIKTMELVRNARPAPPSRSRPGIPPALEAICLKCLEKSPADRYGSAQDLADDLGRWLNDERPQATPDWPTRLRLGFRRNRVAVRIGAASLAAVVALFALGAALLLKDPDRPIREIEGELARGRPVTLIGGDGKPRWMSRLTGTSNSQWDLAPDGEFRIRSAKSSLLELLPDPRSDHYRFSAQVRHESSELGGEAGLFFALETHTGEPRPVPIHVFVQLIYNDRIDLDFYRKTRPKAADTPEPSGNRTRLYVLITYVDQENKYHERRIVIAAGKRYEPSRAPEGASLPWHRLEVIVAPDILTMIWDDSVTPIPISTIHKATVGSLLRRERPILEPLPRDFRPLFQARGGLGLVIRQGSASFRDVKVTPL